MSKVPTTSTSLLRSLAGSAGCPRWGEFVARYRPAMESFMSNRFPGLDAGDIIQETFVAVAKALPDYEYVPDEKGHFHNYLTGILRHKALATLRTEQRRKTHLRNYAESTEEGDAEAGKASEEWNKSIFEIALQQFMADPKVAPRNKQILVRTAIRGEKPEDVAKSLLVTRDVVDQTKKRMLEKIRGIARRLEDAE